MGLQRLATACTCVCLAASLIHARQPNIVLILADDVGREVLECYGGTSYATPKIDRIANEGARCTHAYAMAVCHPTRTTLLTGQYPFRLGHPDWGSFPRSAESRTLPAILQRAGYATAVGGKWQLALLKDDLEQPRRLGFDEYCLYGWHEGPWYYQPHIWHDGRLRTDVRDRYGPDVIADFVIDFIERHRERPFFVFYSMSLCHAETNDLDRPAPEGPHGRYDSYAEMVAKMDERVGRVTATLDRLGLRENTLLIFTSDNGTAAHTLVDAQGDELIYEPVVSKMGDREIPGGKATLTDWGTRVPLLIRWPASIEPATVDNSLVDMSDFLPTLVQLAGTTAPDGVQLDGRLNPRLTAANSPPREWVFAEHKGNYFVRSVGWKLYDDGRFYNMTTDPDETHALNTNAIPDEAAAAQRQLQQALDGLNYSPPQND